MLLAVATFGLPLPLLAAEPIVVLLEGQRREVEPVIHGAAELVPLDDLLAGLKVRVTTDSAAGAATLSFQGREVSLYEGKSLAAIGGDLRLLSSPVRYVGRRWLVPVDSVPRFLGPLLGRPVDWRGGQRVLVIGDVHIPRISVSTFVSGDVARVVLESSEKVPFRAFQEGGRVTVHVARDAVDVAFRHQDLEGDIVQAVDYVGGKDNTFAVTLGPRFEQLKAYEQERPARLVLEFHARPSSASRTATPAPTPAATATPAAPTAQAAGPPIIVIDPGHGGEEVGARGPGGALEKDVTLAIARKLRAYITNTLGYRVFLTRNGDQEVSLDERAAIANNYKADLFISIHANASRSHGAKGSEVYFLSDQASDEESRRVALAEGDVAPGKLGAVGSDIALILWDMAQAEHLEESSALASRIQDALAAVTGSEGRGVKQAPFRVLVGANMPAVLVEVAFISNAEEEKLLVSDGYQRRVAQALMRGIAEFEKEQARRAGIAAPPARPGS